MTTLFPTYTLSSSSMFPVQIPNSHRWQIASAISFSLAWPNLKKVPLQVTDFAFDLQIHILVYIVNTVVFSLWYSSSIQKTPSTRKKDQSFPTFVVGQKTNFPINIFTIYPRKESKRVSCYYFDSASIKRDFCTVSQVKSLCVLFFQFCNAFSKQNQSNADSNSAQMYWNVLPVPLRKIWKALCF